VAGRPALPSAPALEEEAPLSPDSLPPDPRCGEIGSHPAPYLSPRALMHSVFTNPCCKPLLLKVYLPASRACMYPANGHFSLVSELYYRLPFANLWCFQAGLFMLVSYPFSLFVPLIVTKLSRLMFHWPYCKRAGHCELGFFLRHGF